jgi:hypothetical protein
VKALATIGVGPMRPVLDIALESFRPYAERHGYDLVIGSGDSEGRPLAWGKVLLLQRLLDSYEEVLWLDSDMVIVDNDLDLASVVPETAFQAMALQQEYDGAIIPNAGLWFVRARDEAREFLKEVWACERHIDGQGMWDNLAVLELLGYTTERPYRLTRPSRWTEGTHYLAPEWNCPAVGVRSPPGARIMHFFAMANEKRVRLMRLYMLNVEHADEGRGAPFVRSLEWALRRAELSLYFRRHGVAERREYVEGRFTTGGHSDVTSVGGGE